MRRCATSCAGWPAGPGVAGTSKPNNTDREDLCGDHQDVDAYLPVDLNVRPAASPAEVLQVVTACGGLLSSALVTSAAVLNRLLPTAPPGDPTQVLLWCTGRGELNGLPRHTTWKWEAARPD